MELDLNSKELKGKKADMCSAEIEVILKKYELSIKPILISSPEGIIPSVCLIDRDQSSTESNNNIS